MDPLAESLSLHARVRAMVSAFERGEAMPETFDALAVAVARFQASHVPGYRRLCAAAVRDPASIALAAHAPAVPTDAFKYGHVFAFDADRARVTFRTSGTSLGTRGTHRFRDIATYDAAALAFGRAMVARDLSLPISVVVVGPSPVDAPDSSLAHMCALFAHRFGGDRLAERIFFVRDGVLDVVGLRDRVSSMPRASPALVLATSFALVHLLDALAGEVLPLPDGSRVMQTGGFKGKSRTVAPDELRRAAAAAFGVGEAAVIGEYGMTELSSQFWETTLVDPLARHGLYVEPPWARVVPVDPHTLAPVADGEVGLARIEDLANIDSAFAIQTQDRVRRVAGGFELLGRQAGAAPRGCSIALDEMLAGAGES